jgi:regulatory protein
MAKRKRTAYQTALDLLSRRDHFRRELVEKLRTRNFPANEIEDAIARCQDLDLVNDERVAQRFIEVRAADRGWGPHRLAAELRQRGMAADDADRLSDLSQELATNAMRMALRKLEVRAPARWWRDGQRRARMVSSLITRGFEAEVAIAAVDDLAASRENQNHAPDDQ